MNWETLAPVVIGITTVLGLLGFIFYVILYLAISRKTIISPDIISALKESNIKIEDLEKLSVEKAKSYIASHTSISKEIIKSGLSAEIKSQYRIILYISIFLLVTALIIFLLSKKDSSDYLYNGFIFDKVESKAIQNAKISIDDRPDIKPFFSDSKGYFKLRIKESEFKIIIEDENYNKLILSKTMSNINGFDTIILTPKKTLVPSTNPDSNRVKSISKKNALVNTNSIDNSGEVGMEISIQLSNSSKGFTAILVNKEEADILPNSTPKNPIILVTSNARKLQLIEILTKEGDTCILKRVFDKKKQNTFPIRFIPDCQTQKF